ncbi:hypothetical protein HK098_006491 [Nowakowskiella sp. JEL0407]|nr:hypothetical protein HK098_006491 [Nowakowskiella sp. JEL0407]
MLELQPTPQHILNCRFSSWYEKCRAFTMKSKFYPLPASFIDYLLTDGVFLPKNCRSGLERSGHYDDSDDTDHDWSDKDDEEYDDRPSFPDLQKWIVQTIQEFEGAVFPKLNWSSPKDAAWITTTGTLKCTIPADIYILLKSSDFISHDLIHAYDNCQPFDENTQPPEPTFELVLRKWFDLTPSLEFRCFVKQNVLVAISQRDYMSYYPFLKEMKDECMEKIVNFYNTKISTVFPDESYVFDVYVSKSNMRVFLVDFNPFSETTDTLLYSWDEILKGDTLSMRIVESNSEANMTSQYSSNKVPIDLIDASTNGKTLQELAQMFNSMNANIQSEE